MDCDNISIRVNQLWFRRIVVIPFAEFSLLASLFEQFYATQHMFLIVLYFDFGEITSLMIIS